MSVLAAAGEIPEHDHTLHDNYATAGVNVNIPIFNGGLFRARHDEAALQAQAEDKDVADLRLQVGQEVRKAWFEANDASFRIPVTARLVEQARRAQHLAQARYDNGLGSIVELNQAQLNETAAEIEAASAKYEYLSETRRPRLRDWHPTMKINSQFKKSWSRLIVGLCCGDRHSCLHRLLDAKQDDRPDSRRARCDGEPIGSGAGHRTDR